MALKFRTSEQCCGFLSARYQIGGDAPDAIAGQFVTYEFPELPPDTLGLMVPVARWVIRDDDLKLLDALVDGCKAGLVAGFVIAPTTTAGTAGGAAGIITALLKLARQAIKKGRRLSPLEFSVLCAIRLKAEGALDDEILHSLDLITGRLHEPAEVADAVARLALIAVGDGTPVSLIAKDSAGRWHSCGV